MTEYHTHFVFAAGILTISACLVLRSFFMFMVLGSQVAYRRRFPRAAGVWLVVPSMLLAAVLLVVSSFLQIGLWAAVLNTAILFAILASVAAVAPRDPAAPSLVEVDPHVVARQQAVAVGEQEVGGGRGSRALVAAAGELEACVIVRREGQREVRPPRGGGDEPERLVARAVVGDDHFEAAIDPLLDGDRFQTAREVLRTLIGGDDDGDVGRHG